MKLGKSDLNLLQKLINIINSISDSNKDGIEVDIESVYEYIDKEDLVDFLSVLGNVKKSSINNIRKIVDKDKNDKNYKKLLISDKIEYTIEETLEIFNNLTDDKIIKGYKLQELKSMYYSLYSQNPSKSKNKQDIVSTIRNYIYVSMRAKAFN